MPRSKKEKLQESDMQPRDDEFYTLREDVANETAAL